MIAATLFRLYGNGVDAIKAMRGTKFLDQHHPDGTIQATENGDRR